MLYPSPDTDKKNNVWSVILSGGTVVGAFMLAAVLLLQTRLPEETRIFNPYIATAIFVVIAASIRALAVYYFSPLRIFHDERNKKLIFLAKGFFDYARTDVDGSRVERVELEDNSNSGKRSGFCINVFSKEGLLAKLPPITGMLHAKQAAERVAQAAGTEMVLMDKSGREISRHSPGTQAGPLFKRLEECSPPADADGLNISKERGSGKKVLYEIRMPGWVSSLVFVFAALNLALGLFIWFGLPMESARWASVFFFISTFMMFGIAGMMRTFVSKVEVNGSGISVGANRVQFDKLEDIRIESGLLSRLQFISRYNVLEIPVSKKQGEWLKSDIEYERYKRRSKLGKRGKRA